MMRDRKLDWSHLAHHGFERVDLIARRKLFRLYDDEIVHVGANQLLGPAAGYRLCELAFEAVATLLRAGLK